MNENSVEDLKKLKKYTTENLGKINQINFNSNENIKDSLSHKNNTTNSEYNDYDIEPKINVFKNNLINTSFKFKSTQKYFDNDNYETFNSYNDNAKNSKFSKFIINGKNNYNFTNAERNQANIKKNKKYDLDNFLNNNFNYNINNNSNILKSNIKMENRIKTENSNST